MTVYRYQVVSVGYWRGQIKRWNTTFHTLQSTNSFALYSHMNDACYPNPGDTTGDCSGGVASVSVYLATGGAPLEVTEYFDWQNPATWIPFTGGCWGSVPAGTPIDSSGESAAIIIGHLPGLSASGKPVYTRKYIHAVPSRSSADFSVPDIAIPDASALANEFSTQYMLSPEGIQPDQVEAKLWYGNHQRVRGRRRTTSQVAAQSFSSGVVVGAGAAAGGAEPFQ